MVLFYGLPRRQFSVHFALLIAAESTLGALLEPLFGLFQKKKVNSRKFAVASSAGLVGTQGLGPVQSAVLSIRVDTLAASVARNRSKPFRLDTSEVPWNFKKCS